MTTLAPSELATPPRPPIPTLEQPLGPDELEAALRSFHGSYYVQHPFHQLMYEGKLSQRQFQGWVTNRLAIVEVRWPYLTAAGNEIGEETSTYVIRREPDGRLAIRASVMHGEAETH